MINAHNSAPNVTFLTEKGHLKLQKELDYLRKIKRQELAANLHDTFDNEELNENITYMLVKYEQSVVEGRISELERILNHVEIIKPGNCDGYVRLGNTVTIQEEGCPTETYTIVGTKEANSSDGQISNESPLGSALIDHCIGEDVIVKTPGGTLVVRIIAVA